MASTCIPESSLETLLHLSATRGKGTTLSRIGTIVSLSGLLMFENDTTRYQLVGRGTRRCMNKGWDGREPVCEGAVSSRSITYNSAVCPPL